MASGGGSQAGSYGALLAGGVLLAAAISGRPVREVLAGHSSPLRPLLGTPPPPSGSAGGAGSSLDTAFMSSGGTTAHLQAHGYTAPLKSGWTEERTDQGVDFAPSRTGVPVYSPGNAKVLKVGAPGWPSGEKGVLLHLLDGPLKGKNVFIYEAIQPAVRVGQLVGAGQVVGHGVFGETGIEIGFADANGTPLSHAEYTEGKVTVWGTRMRNFLRKLGGAAH